MPKWLDLPPIWLIAMMALGYLAAEVAPAPGWPALTPGLALMALGVLLAVWAALGFRAAKTTIIPHQTPSALITTGAFALSRNPIYLADAIVLVGWLAIWGAAAPFLLVPAFVLIINARFIRKEEARLSAEFGGQFDHYCSKTRRWI